MSSAFSRRKLLAAAAGTAMFAPLVKAAEQAAAAPIRQGRLKQSVMASVWGQNSPFSFAERCEILSMLGFSAVDLPSPDQISIMADYSLLPAMMTGAGTTFQDGLIRKEMHQALKVAPRVMSLAKPLLGATKYGMFMGKFGQCMCDEASVAFVQTVCEPDRPLA